MAPGLYDHLPVPLQNVACTFVGWRKHRARYGAAFRRALAELEASGEASLESLEAIQWRRLQSVLARARTTSPYHRDLPEPVDAGDPAASIRATLDRLPVMEKEDYRAHHESMLRRDLPRSALREAWTSGTTGTPLPLYYTLDTLAEEYATVWRMRRRAGADLGQPHMTFNGQLIVPPHWTRPPYWRRAALTGQTLFSIFHMNPGTRSDYAEGIHAANAAYAEGYPSALFLAAQALLETGRPLPPGRLRAVFTSSESLLAFQRERIEEGFGAPVYDRYGTTEFAVSMTSCSERSLHVDMEFGIVELEVTRETEDTLEGDLVVTGLAPLPVPFIRYRIGDVGVMRKGPCPCGRPGQTFVDVDGRQEDFVVTPEGNVIGRLDHIFKGQVGVVEAQIVQDEVDAIDVVLVPDDDFDDAARRHLLSQIRTRLGDAIAVELRLVDRIPREANGKFRAVKSRLAPLIRDERLGR